jgi:hypothetical protein
MTMLLAVLLVILASVPAADDVQTHFENTDDSIAQHPTQTGHGLQGQRPRLPTTDMKNPLKGNSAEAAQQDWRSVADQLRAKLPKLGALLDGAADGLVSTLSFPRGAVAANSQHQSARALHHRDQVQNPRRGPLLQRRGDH